MPDPIKRIQIDWLRARLADQGLRERDPKLYAYYERELAKLLPKRKTRA